MPAGGDAAQLAQFPEGVLLFRIVLIFTLALRRGTTFFRVGKKCFASLRRPPKNFAGFHLRNAFFQGKFRFPRACEYPSYSHSLSSALCWDCCIFVLQSVAEKFAEIRYHGRRAFSTRSQRCAHCGYRKVGLSVGGVRPPWRPNPKQQGVRGPQAPEKIFRFLTGFWFRFSKKK